MHAAMQSDQAPCNATGLVEFPASVTNCLRDQRQEVTPLLGGIFSDSKLAWLSKGPLLEVVNISDGAKIAAWTFGAVVRDFKTKVTCVTELPRRLPTGRLGPIDQMVVGLECELTGGMVCLFNIAGSRVLRAVNIPSKVTALNVVTYGREPLAPLNDALKGMSGIAAIGTNDGQILLVDLRREDCDQALRSGSTAQWDGVCDELQSCGIIPLKKANTSLIEEYPDDHVYLHLNEKYFLKQQRLVVQLPARDGKTFLPEDPSVTSVLYVPQLTSLCVGFAFGSFQIWSLQSLSLIYVLPCNEPNPVVQLSFQEACDDPNAYCYLWAVRGGLHPQDSSGDLDQPVQVFGPPSATMFSLCYDEKVWIPGYGHSYKNFTMCSTGFEYDLSGGKETVGGRLISLYSVSRGMPDPSVVQSPSEDSSASGSLSNGISLCLLVWETWGPTGPSIAVNPINIHMAIFDINQWYVDQMPSRLSQRGGTSRNKSVASYLVSYDLGKVLSASGGLLVDVRVNADTLVQFSSVQNVEEFSRPSSLTFVSEVLMERQVVHLKHPGVQRALLANLLSTGPSALMTPTNLFHECLVLGLRPLLMDVSSSMNVPIDEQRTFVLCVALEQRLGRFICRCAREWADGRLSAAGCTLSWLLSVAWNRAAVLKQLAIRICAQLFDHSGEKLDDIAQRQLHHIVGIFHLLKTLFESVVQNKWHLALNEWPQVELQSDALKLECQYYDVLQWLVEVQLLPEGLHPVIPYPAQDIAVYYQSRRQELQRLLQQQGEEEATDDLLLIDGLLKNQPGGVNIFAEWERDAGSHAGPGAGRYPPISLQALLRTFLVKDVALEVKYGVVIYALLDLANTLDNDQYQATLQNFIKFPAAFCMSVGSMRLTQAFWHLDHKEFNTALDMLLDPLVSVRDIVPWQHRSIIRLLTLQGQANMALRYVRARRPPLQDHSDIRLHLKLLIANDLMDEAFKYQRDHRSNENSASLLKLFYQGCEERNHLKTVLRFSLDDEEEVAFSHYLESSKHPAADDLRVLFLLKRSRYVEALDVNQDLKKKGRSGGTRDVVVNGFYKTLPSVTRKLAVHCAQQQHKIRSWTQVEKPTPLFVNPKIASPEMRYKSSILEAAVEKSRETWARLIDPVTSGVEATPFLCTPRTKLLHRLRAPPSSVTKSECNVANRKRIREEDTSDFLDAANLKRSRFQKLETVLAELQQQQQHHQEQQKAVNARYSTLPCTDTLPLLSTPVVQRRSPSSRAKLQQQISACSPGHKAGTPQSIIKVRQASGSSKSGSPKRVMIKDIMNEPELTEEESETDPFSSSKVTKGESETDSEPGDNVEDEGPVGVTARRIIDFDSDISLDLSQSQSSFESQSSSRSPQPNQSIVGSERSLSRLVVLSEARKAGKPTVTFGKGSVCVYDQDEPVDAHLAVQDESSNDTVDQEPSNDENPQDQDDQQGDEVSSQIPVNLPTKQSPEDTKFRSFRLDTSGIGTMSASEISADLSRTEDSEVFQSADSTAQGTIYSPTFRKSLARPSLREMTRRFKRGQHDDESGSDEDDGQVRKSARLEGVPQPISTSDVTHATGRLARPPIKSDRVSIGVSIETVSHQIEIQESSDLSDMYSAHSHSLPDVSEITVEQLDEVPNELEREQVDMIPSVSEGDVEADVSVKPRTSSSLIEIVDLDDNSTEADGSPDVVMEEEEDCENMQEEAAHLGDEDSRDRILLPNDSNIFGTSQVDNSDVTSDDESEYSQSQSEKDTDHLSNDSESSVSRNCENFNQSNVLDSDEISADNVESQTSNEANLNQACVVETYEISVDASEVSNKDMSPNEAHIVDSEDFGAHNSESEVSTAGTRLKQTAEEDMIVEELQPPVAVKADSPSLHITNMEHSSDHPEELPSSEKASSSMVTEMEHDDMPKLRLDAAASNENLCTSPEDTHTQQSSAVVCVETVNTFGSSKDGETEVLKPAKDSNISSPQANETAIASASGDNAPSTPKPSRRKGTARRSSVSSTISEIFEEDASSRRVTRSQQRSQMMNQSFESTTGNSNETFVEPLPADHESEASLPVSKGRTRRGSLSSQDAQKGASKQSQTHSSVDSDDIKGSTEIKGRRRRASVSSQGSATDKNLDRLSDDKLGKMKEESDKASETLSKTAASFGADSPVSELGGRRQRKHKTSAVSEMSVDDKAKSCLDSSSVSANASVMETYETSRRLTRHQRALLAKSMEMSSVHSTMRRPIHPSVDDEDDQASDDDRMSVCSVRSSQRLRAKRQQEAMDSPSSTASTIINPSLTPTQHRRRRQSSSDVSELNRDISPVSSVRRQRSLQPPGTPSSLCSTPTRRSARVSAKRQSEDGDNQSLASLSPSSVTSGKKRASRRAPRRLSVSSEGQSEQYAFASPQVEHPSLNENADADLTEAFVFSPPKTVATPSKARSTPSKAQVTPNKAKGSSTESTGSASKRSTRQSKASALQTIKEESSTSKISLEDTASDSPIKKPGRPSWFFFKPNEEEGEEDGTEPQTKKDELQKRKSVKGRKCYYSAFPRRKIPEIPKMPQSEESSSNHEEEEGKSEEELEEQVKSKPKRTTRKVAPSRRQRK